MLHIMGSSDIDQWICQLVTFLALSGSTQWRKGIHTCLQCTSHLEPVFVIGWAIYKYSNICMYIYIYIIYIHICIHIQYIYIYIVYTCCVIYVAFCPYSFFQDCLQLFPRLQFCCYLCSAPMFSSNCLTDLTCFPREPLSLLH